MPLQEFRSRMMAEWHQVPFDDWNVRLQSACGRFQSHTRERDAAVHGGVSTASAAGVDVVQVANDLDVVRREHADIRRDIGEHLFLLLQLEGTAGIEQLGRQTVITPGECILVDSSLPSVFHFNARFSNQLSVHLPRQLLLADRPADIGISQRLAADDPMAALLHALIAKLMQTDASSRRAPELRGLMFQATRQAFAADPDDDVLVPGERAASRLEIAQILIDRHLTDEMLTPRWLAGRLGISLRTLQDDFSLLGTSVTSYIRARRLLLARDRLLAMRHGGVDDTIAGIALASGFNDISYFNRCFRETFDCSPKHIGRS